MEFRFAVFNDCTLLVMALTVAVVIARFRAKIDANWPLAYYVVLAGYAVGFKYSVSLYAVGAGVSIALLLRFGRLAVLRWAEIVMLIYVWWRCLGLVLGW